MNAVHPMSAAPSPCRPPDRKVPAGFASAIIPGGVDKSDNIHYGAGRTRIGTAFEALFEDKFLAVSRSSRVQ